MASDGANLWSAIDQAKSAQAELRRCLNFLVDGGLRPLAYEIVSALHAEFSDGQESKPEGVNSSLPPANSNVSDTPAPSASAQPRPLSMDSRDIPARNLKDRALRKSTVEDIILIYLAQNPHGVVPGDVGDELKRLALTEPTGTTASRIARMRGRGDVAPYSNSAPGIWIVTAQGRAEAQKAVKRRNLSVEFPPVE